jgi:glycosyltransferase involved in cell wall biosynthesis
LEKYIHGMAHEIVRAGDELDLFLTGGAQSWHANANVFSLAQAPQKAPSLWNRAIGARRCFAANFNEPYDVINLHFAMNALPLIPFISRRTLRVVHFHGPWAAESRAEGGGRLVSFVKMKLERYVYDRVDRFITLSSAFKDVLVDSYGIDPARISVIPMGIDIERFRPAADPTVARKVLGWPTDVPIFFTARRLVHRVGLLELVRAVALLKTTQPRFLLKIAGRGPLAPQLRALIGELGLSEHIELLGFISEEELVHAYQGANVTVLPTQSLEGFGTIISESLACGTPVIVTPVGGMPEAVAPLGEQLISRSAEPAAIAERLEGVLDGTLLLPDAATCRSYALRHYDWREIWLQIRQLFAQHSSRGN